MTRRFVISVDDTTADVQNKITNYLLELKVWYWHHLAYLWLVVTDREDLSAAMIRNGITNLTPASTIVLEITDTDWAARSPVRSHKWLDEFWTDEPGTS